MAWGDVSRLSWPTRSFTTTFSNTPASPGQEIRQLLDAAIKHGELRPCDTNGLAEAIQVTYNGALITWAIFRQGPLALWLRRQLEFTLWPFRTAGQHTPASAAEGEASQAQ